MSGKEKEKLVLFDFDGTLTHHDSLFYFLRFFKGNLFFFYKVFLSLPSLIGYKLGMTDASNAKEKLLSNFLKGLSVSKFGAICIKFGKEIIPAILNQKILEKFHCHISDGDRVIIVSASIEDWILPWAKQWNVEVIATKLASQEGVLTGKLKGANCNYEEKLVRLKTHLELTNYSEIWAYGDSSGDEAMFGIATKVVYRGKVRN